MARTVWPRIFVVFILVLFMAPAVFAAPREAKQIRSERGVFTWLTQALEELLPGLKSSGTMNPDGKPLATPPASTTSDSSGTMDPDGRS